MRIVSGLTAALLATAAATPALAQDADQKGFSGLYVGGSVGYAIQSNDLGSAIKFDRNLDGTFGDPVPTSTGATAFAPGYCSGFATTTANINCLADEDRVDYYGRVGFDIQRGNIVFGVIGEAGRAQIADSVSAFSTTPAAYIMKRTIAFNAAVRARVGYTPNNSTLMYVTGGGAYGRVRNSFSQIGNTTNAFTTNGSQDDYGYSAGGGFEQKIGNHFSIGLEYIYTSLKDKKARVRASNGGATPATNPFLLGNANGTDFARADDNFRWSSIRVTAAFRF